ncbi:MAG: CU044_5270 family protein [Solirubrobacteraceae bacterium]
MSLSSNQVRVPERYRHELGEALVAYAGARVPAPSRPASRWTHSVLPTAAGVAVVAAVIVVLVGVGVGGRGVTNPHTGSAASLPRVTSKASDQSAQTGTLGPGEFDYTEILQRVRYGANPPYVLTSLDRSWIAADGSGRDIYRVLSAVRLTPAGPKPLHDLSRAGPAFSDSRLQPASRPFVIVPAPALYFSYAHIRQLPVDPRLLSARIDSILRSIRMSFPGLHMSYAQARAAARFIVIRGLAEAPAPPALLAGLYRVLAATPGLQLLGPVKDAAGRTGTEIAVRINAVQLALIVDPRTGQLLESRRAVLFRSSQFPGPPGVVNQVTYLTRQIVKSD